MNVNTRYDRASDLSHAEMERLINRGKQLRNETITAGLKAMLRSLKRVATQLWESTRNAEARKAATSGCA